jgi:hypothetical protein
MHAGMLGIGRGAGVCRGAGVPGALLGCGPGPPHSVESACDAHHDGGGDIEGAGDGLKSGGAPGGQHRPT